MMKKFLYLLAFIFFSYSGLSQNKLRGRVISKETQKPVPSASVYLNNTSLGVTTDENGVFVLSNIPPGKVTLVVSCVGYETYQKFMGPGEYANEITISLDLKPEELPGVVLVPFDPDGWQDWGKLFTQLFIGTSPNASQCRIENPEVIRFRLNADNTLSVFAKRPILVMNYALGYEISYKPDEFSFDLSTQILTQKGFTLYRDLSAEHSKKASRYEKERKEVYQGSLMHFMREFFVNDLDSSGFQIRSLAWISNRQKDRAKMLFSLHKDSVLRDTTSISLVNTLSSGYHVTKMKTVANTTDSAEFYKKLLSQPDLVISHQLMPANKIGFVVDSTVAGLYFSDSLEVSYHLKKVSSKYRLFYPGNKKESFPVSQFVFMHKKPVYVISNGYYYDVYDLKITGYWAWWETMANKLPYNYYPDKN